MANNVPFKPNSSLEVNGPIEFLKGTVTESSGSYNIDNGLIERKVFNFANSGGTTYTESAETRDICFKPDGTAMFVLEEGISSSFRGVIRKFDLSTAWDLSTATYNASESADTINTIGTQTEVTSLVFIRCFLFSPDGTKLFVATVNNSSPKILQIPLTTAWDVSASSGTVQDLGPLPDTSATPLGPKAMSFNDDGTELFSWCSTSLGINKVYKSTLSSAYDISVVSGTTTELADTVTSIQDSGSLGTIVEGASIRFNEDGTKVFFWTPQQDGDTNYIIRMFNLSTAYDVTTIEDGGPYPTTPDATFDFTTLGYTTGYGSPVSCDIRSIAFGNDGKKLYTLGTQLVTEYDIGGNRRTLDLSTGNYFEVNLDADSDLVFDNARDVDLFSVKINGVSDTGGTVASNFSTSSNLNGLISFSTPWGIDLVDDGTKLYLYDFADEQVKYVSLSTPYDVSSGSFTYTNFTSTSASGAVDFRSLTIRDSGSKMHLTTGTTVHQWTLNTPYSLSSTTYNGSITPTSSRAGWNIFWNNDGTRLYSAATANAIQQMDLSTAYDITSTVTDSGISPNMTRTLYGIDLDETGTYVYYVTNINADQIVYRATLSTPYDITTLDWATEVEIDLSTTFGMPSSSNFSGCRVVDGGKKVVVLDNSYDVVRVFNTLATPSITLSPNVNVLGTQTSVTNESSARYTFSTKNGGKTFIGTQTGTDFS